MTKGRSSFTVRKSPIHGRGVFASSSLPPRRKIGEVHGTLRPLPEARRAVEQRRRIYLIELSTREALDCSRGGPLKFLNHCCRANCYLRVFRKRVEVYSRIGIAAGEELTVDYGVTPHRGGMKCSCGTANCRRRL